MLFTFLTGSSPPVLRPGTSTELNVPTSKKQGGRGLNANHLLNFQVSQPHAATSSRATHATSTKRRPPPPRKHLGSSYNKESFLNANYRFLLSDAIDERDYHSNPDKMVEWESVIQVELASHQPLHCPISLDSPPVCPHVTPCGHYFSLPSIIQHLMNASGGEGLRCSAPCPLCFAPIVARELKLLCHRRLTPPAKVGDTRTFTLLSRSKDSILPQARALPSNNSSSSHPLIAAGLQGNLFVKFACVDEVEGLRLWQAAAVELATYARTTIEEGGLEATILAPAVFTALDSLASRAKKWHANRWRMISVPSSGSHRAAGAVTEEMGREVEREADRLGSEAEAMVREAFTAIVSVAPPSFPSASASASVSSPSASLSGMPRSRNAIEDVEVFPPLPASLSSSTKAPPSSLHIIPRASPPPPPPPRPKEDREFSFDAAFSDDNENEEELDRSPRVREKDATQLGDSSEEGGSPRALVSSSSPPFPAFGGRPAFPPSSSSSPPNPLMLGTSPPPSSTSTMTHHSPFDEFSFYQSNDGTMFFVHPLSLRCLLHHYGDYSRCPPSLTAPILELETMVQNEASRKKYRFLSHLPTCSTFHLAELRLTDVLPPESLAPFQEEIASRDKRRKKRAAEGKREAAREAAAEAAARVQRGPRAPTAAELQAMPALGRSFSPPSLSPLIPSHPPPPRLQEAGGSSSAHEDVEMQRAIAASLAPDSSAYPALSSPSSSTGGGPVGWSHLVKMGFAATGPSLTSSLPLAGTTAPPPPPPLAWGKKVFTGGPPAPSAADKAGGGEGEGEGEGGKGVGGGGSGTSGGKKKVSSTLLFTSGPTR